MNRSYFDMTANPLLTWMSIAGRATQMWMASAEVVAARTRTFAAAGVSPGAADVREFNLMWQEKLVAATQSWLALSSQMMKMNQELMFSPLRTMTSAMNPMMFGAPSAAHALRESIAGAARLSGAGARVVRSGLDPVHRRARANAARLRRKGVRRRTARARRR
jgi:hypothetical protein